MNIGDTLMIVFSEYNNFKERVYIKYNNPNWKFQFKVWFIFEVD